MPALLQPSVPRDQVLAKASLEEAIGAVRPLMVNTVGRLDTGSALLGLWASRHLTWAILEALPETSPALFRKDPDAERGRRLCMSGTVAEIRAEKSLAARLIDDRAQPLIVRPSTPSYGSAGGSGASSDPTAGGVATGLAGDAMGLNGDFAVPDDGKVYVAVVEAKASAGPDARGTRTPQADPLVVEVIAVKSSGSLVDGSDARVCGVLTGVTLGSLPRAGATDITEHRIVGMFDLPENH